MKEKKEQLIKRFTELYGEGGEIRSYFAPGRVNLIGEHTDYNGGHVFPCALTIGTYFTARKREDRKLRFYSENFPKAGIIEGSLDHLVFEKKNGWANYPLGMMWTFEEKGYQIPNGFDILVYGNIPNGSGLSSSASVEIGTGVLLKDMCDFDMDMIEIAILGQYSENHFNKVNCGIMDQFAIAMGKKDHAILLDTSDLSYEYAPISLEDARIVIACSNKKRALSDSSYNQRRTECNAALSEIQEAVGISALGDLTEEQFESYKSMILDETWLKRARHAVYENRRTIRAVEVLKAGNLEEFGKLMNASHDSLRDDYEVTGEELDTLVSSAWKQEGVIGSRMTGAGFGGCTVSIVKNDFIEAFKENVGKEYLDRIGYAADFYVVEIGDGARRI